jgi:choline dehydrogenase-like flavoprotein
LIFFSKKKKKYYYFIFNKFLKNSIIGTNLTEILTGYAVNLEEWADYWRPLMGDQRHFYVFYAVYRPRSRGTVRLSSSNPTDPPLIDPNYFANNYDLGVVVDTMSTGMRLTEGKFFRKYAQIYNKTIPGCKLCDSGPYYNCYSYLACVAQTITATSYHPVGKKSSKLSNHSLIGK